MATATKTTKGVSLACPKCGACDNPPQLDLNLNNLDEISCGECSEVFSAQYAVEEFGRKHDAWRKALAWIEAAPVDGGDEQ